MNRSLKISLFALVSITLVAMGLSYRTNGFSLGSSPVDDYVQQEIDTLSSKYTELSQLVYSKQVELFNLEQKLAYADSVSHGGDFIFLATFRCTTVEVTMPTDTIPSKAFLITLPVSRNFYDAVEVGNVLQAGTDYGFIYGEKALYGLNITIIAKNILRHE